MATTDDLKHLPLEGLHREAGARFGGFAGWSMPLTYPAGVMKEHLHCRSAAGLFDISHMKLFGISGRDAAALLSKACPIDAGAMPVGQSKYTFFLNDDAGILDDLIVTRTAEARYVVVANAGNAQADETHLRGLARDFDVDVEALDRVFLALQGPAAARVAEAVGLGAGHLSFMQAFEPETGWFVSRSGYTGEDGFEIALPPAQAEAFARRLLAQPDVEWIGLAARDSLRLEAGLCLHGQDIAPDTTPVEAGLLWAIAKPLRNGGRFVGAAALAAAVAAGPGRKRVGLKPEGRQPVRAGSPIVDAAGRPIGMVTSGGFGPSVEGPVAMGYVETGMLDAPLFAEVRGSRLPVSPCPLPFHPHRMRKG